MTSDRRALLHDIVFSKERADVFYKCTTPTAYYALPSSFPGVVSCSLSAGGDTSISVQQDSSEVRTLSNQDTVSPWEVP